LTATLVAKLAPPVPPPNENVWLRPSPAPTNSANMMRATKVDIYF